MTAKRIILAGGSGFLGRLLAREFTERGDDVYVISRQKPPTWDALDALVDGADVVINLAGRSVHCRYNARNRRAIFQSRIDTTNAIAAAIARASSPPRVWLQMSTATIYAHRYFAPNDEVSGIIGGEEADVPPEWGFSIDVAKAWEQAAKSDRTRVVLLRSAMVMAPEHGSAFEILLRLVRCGLGGRAGDGRQYMSWIHHRDFVRAVMWLIDHESIAGPVNLASPNPMPNAAFMRELREAWGTRVGLPIPEWMIEAGAFILRNEPELILKSRRVVPKRLLDSGFKFDMAQWSTAARDLCNASRRKHNAENLRSVRLSLRPLLSGARMDADAAGVRRY